MFHYHTHLLIPKKNLNPEFDNELDVWLDFLMGYNCPTGK